jgi:predicted nucleic acid-binding protein
MGSPAVSTPAARCLLDSNALMAYLNQDPAPGLQECIEHCLSTGAAVSVITVIEVLGWRGHDDASRVTAKALLDSLARVDLDDDVITRTIALRSLLSIKLPDAVIAASALHLGVPLVTRNVRDFARIDGLQVIDPYAEHPLSPP